MSVIDDLIPLLKKLKLGGLLETLELRTRQAAEDDLSHAEFLYRLVSDEIERRDARQLEQRVRRASFEHARTLEDFDFFFNPRVPKAKILDLATCTFAIRKQNALLLGPTGVGKSHLAQALGHRACRAGHKTLFTSADSMLKQLRASRSDNTYERRLLRFTTPDVLILDDLGLVPLKGEEALDLYEIIRARYQRGSTVITSNRSAAEIGKLFPDPLLASAAMDRLLHDAHILVLEGDSFRNPPGKKQKKTKNEKEPVPS